MVRQTSIDAYHEIKENGLLAGLQLEVLEYIVFHEPCTQKQVCLGLSPDLRRDRSITPRFAELKEKGVITEQGTVMCQYTGHPVYLWISTGCKPKNIKKTTCRMSIWIKKDEIDSLLPQIERTRPPNKEEYFEFMQRKM